MCLFQSAGASNYHWPFYDTRGCMPTKLVDDRRFHTEVLLEALQMAYDEATDAPPWIRAQLGGRLSIGLCERGRLRDAARFAEIAWEHAIDGQRRTQGLVTAEAIAGYQGAAAARFAVHPLTSGALGLAHSLDDMVAVYRRSHDKTDEFNRHSLVPVSNPAGDVRPEDVQAGEPSAKLALLQGRPGDAVAILDRAFDKIAEEHRGTRGYLSLQVLRLESAALCDAPWHDGDKLAALQAVADSQDVRWLVCGLARIRALLDLRAGRPRDALVHLEAALPTASSWALGRCWLELMTERVALLRVLGRLAEARVAARLLLTGEAADRGHWWVDVAPVPAGLHEGHRAAILEGCRVFAGAEAEIEGLTQARALLDRVVTRTTIPKRRDWNADPDRPHTRQEMHAQALEVLRERESEGIPFVLYLTSFDFHVHHTASPFGPELLENALLDALPDGVNIVRIQEQGALDAYGSTAISMRRRAPALLLGDEIWQSVAEALIATADLIVSECPRLGEGVRFELERAYRLGRWDRTVLVLPPLRSYLEPVDNNPVIHLFPLCVWADELHRQSFFELPTTRPMLERLHALADLPSEEARALITPQARAAFMPLDLEAIAAELTRRAQLALAFEAEDDATRYYAFWNIFRAAALRAMLFVQGQATDEVMYGLASNQLDMSTAMLDHAEEGGRITFKGDLENGEQMAISARTLFEMCDDFIAAAMAEAAQRRIDEYRSVRAAIAKAPEHFRIAPIYGPFRTRSA